MGGAEATGRLNDTAAVYTPAFHQYNEQGQRQVYVWNVSLPEGFFSRAPLHEDPGASQSPVYNCHKVHAQQCTSMLFASVQQEQSRGVHTWIVTLPEWVFS